MIIVEKKILDKFGISKTTKDDEDIICISLQVMFQVKSKDGKGKHLMSQVPNVSVVDCLILVHERLDFVYVVSDL